MPVLRKVIFNKEIGSTSAYLINAQPSVFLPTITDLQIVYDLKPSRIVHYSKYIVRFVTLRFPNIAR
ncbi:hypothetical protein [Nostoc sp.]|uniref:hypothetical protein n=1 Tax=Nostoc sp. TaxID=1180 RepID=UPI002FF5097A